MYSLSDDDIDLAYAAIIEGKDNDNMDKDDVLRIFEQDTLGEASWEAQRIRGRIAAKLGYQAVEMEDEHGISYLITPGVKLTRILPSSESLAPDGNGGTVSPAVFARSAKSDRVVTGAAVHRTAITQGEVNKVITSVIDGLPNGLQGTNIRVVETFYDLPEDIIRQAITDGAVGAIDGVRADDGIYLVRDKLTSLEHAEKTLLHELAHEGLRKLFGVDITTKLNQLVLAVGGQSGLHRIAAKHGVSIKEDAKWLNANKKQKQSVRNQVLTDELLARIAEESPSLKTKVLEIVGMIRNWLRAHGFVNLASGTDADLMHILKQGRAALGSSGSKNNGSDIVFSRTASSDSYENEAMREISDIKEVFRYKTSDSKTVEGIVADVDKDIIVRKNTSIPGETRYEFTLPDQTTARMMVRPFNKYGKSIYGFDLDANNEMTNQEDDRPGRFPEEVDGKGDVWIDVSLLNEGGGFGSKIYHIAANYAFNTDRVFIGDPAGMSHDAMLRRPEQMLSSALKFGTTEHLAPHPKQIKGNPENGIAPLDWVYGDHIGNIEKLIDLTIRNIDNAGGIGGIKYDNKSGEFNDSTGGRITRDDLYGLAEAGLARKASAGGSTLARYAFLTSLLQSLPTRQPGRNASGIMEQLRKQLRDHVSTLDKNGSRDAEIFYAKNDNLEAFSDTHTAESFGAVMSDALNSMRKGLSGILSHPQVKIITDSQIPDRVIGDRYAYEIGGRVYAYVDPKDGSINFVADNIPKNWTAAGLQGLAKHEIAVHALQMGRDSAEFTSILTSMQSMRKAGNASVQEAYRNVPRDTPAHLVDEEALGYLVQHAPHLSVVQHFTTWLKQQIRALGKAIPIMRDKVGIFDWANKLTCSPQTRG